MNARKLIPVAIILALIIIGIAIWKVNLVGRFLGSKIESSEDLSKLTQNIKLELESIKTEDHFLGNPAAPVQVIEYADTTCSHCADMEVILQKVLDPEIKKGNVVWVFRNFLSDAKDNKEARYLECTAKISGNENYWNFLDKLFSTPLSNKTEDFLNEESKKLGVSQKLLADCLVSDFSDKKVEADMNKGIAAGVIGTPYIFIIKKDGKVKQIVGLVPQVSIEAALNEAEGVN